MKVATFGEGEEALSKAGELMTTVATRYGNDEIEKHHLYQNRDTLLNALGYAAKAARAKSKAKTTPKATCAAALEPEAPRPTKKKKKKQAATAIAEDATDEDEKVEGIKKARKEVESKPESSSPAGAPSSAGAARPVYSTLPGPSFEIENDLDLQIERMLST